MRVVNIYVEGNGGIACTGQCIYKHFNIKFDYEFDRMQASSEESAELNVNLRVLDASGTSGGIDSKKISSLINEISSVNIPRGIESILLIDADTPEHSHPPGGYQQRTEYLNKLRETTEFDFFLIPNNSDDGNLEYLLSQIISEDGLPFYSCLSSYIECLKALDDDTAPQGVQEIADLDKERFGWYVYMMQGKGKAVESPRDYLQTDYWNLSAPALEPLRSFLEEVLDG